MSATITYDALRVQLQNTVLVSAAFTWALKLTVDTFPAAMKTKKVVPITAFLAALFAMLRNLTSLLTVSTAGIDCQMLINFGGFFYYAFAIVIQLPILARALAFTDYALALKIVWALENFGLAIFSIVIMTQSKGVLFAPSPFCVLMGNFDFMAIHQTLTIVCEVTTLLFLIQKVVAARWNSSGVSASGSMHKDMAVHATIASMLVLLINVFGSKLATQYFPYLESIFSLMNTINTQILIIAIYDTGEVIKNAKSQVSKKQPLSSTKTDM